jgi:signal transduction histidine kinase
VGGQNGGHMGLVGMRERAITIGGTLTVFSRPHEGTTVSVRVPQRVGAANAPVARTVL